MLRLVLSAMRARRAQSLAVLVLCALAVASAAAAPLYVFTAARRSIDDQVRVAPMVQRIASISQFTSPTGTARDLLDTVDATATQTLPKHLGTTINGIGSSISFVQGDHVQPARIAYRDGMCAHMTVTGACPSGPNQIMLTARSAATLGLRVGSRATIVSLSGQLTVTVTGEYTYVNPTGDYWTTPLLTGANAPTPTQLPDPVFVGLETMAEKEIPQVEAVVDVYVTPAAFTDDAGLATELTHARSRLQAQQMTLSPGVITLANSVAKNRHLVRTGVFVPVAELLGMCWFALFLAVRYTAEQRRSDTGLVKLRGSTRWTLFRLSVGQGFAAVVSGLVVGLAGLLIAVRLWKPLSEPTAAGWELSVVAVVLTMVGALVAIVAADWRTARLPVGDLLRKVPPRRRGVRTDIADLVIVVLAIACAYQAWVDPQVSFMTTLAPSLVALAITLIVARSLLPICAAVGAAAMRGARLSLAIGTLQIARRPGADRVFVLLAVSTALLSASVLGWHAAATASSDRAVIDMGAARVLTVSAANGQQLMRDVDAADPTGKKAMAAMVYQSSPVPDALTESVVTGPILAVDARRFADLTDWSPLYGSTDPTRIGASLLAPAPAPIYVSGATVSVDATASGGPAYLRVHVVSEATGLESALDLVFPNGRHTVIGSLTGCTTSRCWVESLELTARPLLDGSFACGYQKTCPPTGQELSVHGISAAGTVVAGPDVLADVTRWRGNTLPGLVGLAIGHADGSMQMLVDPGFTQLAQGVKMDFHAYVAGGPIPLPAVQAGPSTTDLGITRDRSNSFNGHPIALRIMDAVPLLPAVGAHGLIVDLPSLEHLTSDAGTGVAQVWLAPHTPASIVDRLKATGLYVLSDDSIGSDRTRLSREGPATALTFQLLIGVVSVLLAVTALAAAASAERPSRAGDLAVMRTQGLSARVATTIGYGGYGVLAGAAVVFGVLAAVIAQVIVHTEAPLFIDTWTLVPREHGVVPGPTLVSVVAVALVFGFAAAIAGRSLTVDARRRSAS